MQKQKAQIIKELCFERRLFKKYFVWSLSWSLIILLQATRMASVLLPRWKPKESMRLILTLLGLAVPQTTRWFHESVKLALCEKHNSGFNVIFLFNRMLLVKIIIPHLSWSIDFMLKTLHAADSLEFSSSKLTLILPMHWNFRRTQNSPSPYPCWHHCMEMSPDSAWNCSVNHEKTVVVSQT